MVVVRGSGALYTIADGYFLETCVVVVLQIKKKKNRTLVKMRAYYDNESVRDERRRRLRRRYVAITNTYVRTGQTPKLRCTNYRDAGTFNHFRSRRLLVNHAITSPPAGWNRGIRASHVDGRSETGETRRAPFF